MVVEHYRRLTMLLMVHPLLRQVDTQVQHLHHHKVVQVIIRLRVGSLLLLQLQVIQHSLLNSVVLLLPQRLVILGIQFLLILTMLQITLLAILSILTLELKVNI